MTVMIAMPVVATSSRWARKTPPKWIEADRKITRLGRSARVILPTSSPPALPARALTYSMKKNRKPHTMASSIGAPTETTAAR